MPETGISNSKLDDVRRPMNPADENLARDLANFIADQAVSQLADISNENKIPPLVMSHVLDLTCIPGLPHNHEDPFWAIDAIGSITEEALDQELLRDIRMAIVEFLINSGIPGTIIKRFNQEDFTIGTCQDHCTCEEPGHREGMDCYGKIPEVVAARQQVAEAARVARVPVGSSEEPSE